MSGFECCKHCESTETCGQYENRHPIPCPWPNCQPTDTAPDGSDATTAGRGPLGGDAA